MSISHWHRYTAEHPRTVDLATAVLLFVGFLIGSRLDTPGEQLPGLWPAVVLGLNSCASLLIARAHPRVSVVVTTACVMTATALGHLLTALTLAPVMVAMYRLAVDTDRRTTRAYGLAVIALLVATALVLDPADHPLILMTVSPVAWTLMPMIAGNATRLRRAYAEAVRARAEYAERTREEEARLRVAEERMRIARELHDVVAHHMALANAQAGTAAHLARLARSRPEDVHRMLVELTGTTSSALRELKATVGVLQQGDDPEAPSAPAPGLAQLPELTALFTSTGLAVAVTTEGVPGPLDSGVDLTAYRIVQEALTNVTKHTSAGAAHVRLAYSGDRLTVTVTDDGGGDAALDDGALDDGDGDAALVTAPHGPGGFGLIGMRERAHSVGGGLRAGHRPEGGFEVTTDLPLRPRTPSLPDRR